MDQIGQQQDEHRAVPLRNDLQDQHHDGQGRDRARQDVAGIGSLYANGTGPRLPSARDVGEGNATDYGHGGGDGGKRKTVPHVAQKLTGQMTGGRGFNGPLDQEHHRDAERGREHEQEVARTQQGHERRAGLRNRFSVSTGGLIKPASLSEPSFASEKDKGARDQREAQTRGRGVVESSGHLLVDGVGKGLIPQERHRAEIRRDVQNG